MGGERRETRPAAVMAQDAITYSEVGAFNSECCWEMYLPLIPTRSGMVMCVEVNCGDGAGGGEA